MGMGDSIGGVYVRWWDGMGYGVGWWHGVWGMGTLFGMHMRVPDRVLALFIVV